MLLQPTEDVAEGSADTEPSRQLIVAWQDPSTRAFHLVGYLEVYEGPRFRFSYDEDSIAKLPNFEPFPNFPDSAYDYESPDLFPFFANRVLSPKRAEYPSLLKALALTQDSTPVELLERTAGERATDKVQVFPLPRPDADGTIRLVFPAHGVRYLPGASERIQQLKPGDDLGLRDDHGNEYNSHALLVTAGKPLGWVPDFLISMVRDLTTGYGHHHLKVVAANGPEVPYNLRLLCRLQVHDADGWRPSFD